MGFLTWYVNRRIRKGDLVKVALPYLLKMEFVQSHRRVLALVALALVGVLQFLTSPDLLNECAGATGGFCAWVTTAQHTLVGLAVWAGTVGTIFRNDPPSKEAR